MAKTSLKVKQARKQKYSTRECTRCSICGRPHSVLKKYGICRVCFRKMAVSTNGTKLADLINPEVVADIISAELPNAIVLAPLATVGRTLEGRAGNTVKMPAFAYIGDASDVAEGADIEISKMGTSEKEVTIKKAGKGIELTDEAVLSGFGDVFGEGTRQLKMSIANILLSEGYVSAINTIENGIKKDIKITLKYGPNGEKVISGIKRISKPGLRVFSNAEELPKVINGLGIAIISTNKGVMTDKQARALNVGGEVLAYVW